MANTQAGSGVRCGTMMVREGLALPGRLDMAMERYAPGWRTVADDDAHGFDGRLRQLGWSCFFLAGELKTVWFGPSEAGVLKSAVRGLLSKVRDMGFNSVEFTKISKYRCLGIRYVRVCGHARHIQLSSQLDRTVIGKPHPNACDETLGSRQS